LLAPGSEKDEGLLSPESGGCVAMDTFGFRSSGTL
jgi:hypothetical protein